MNRHSLAGLSAIGLMLTAGAAMAATGKVGIKNSAFSSASLTINAADVVEFRNEDTVYHNIMSVSDTDVFDLEAFGPGEVRKVTFSTPGKIDVICRDHKSMKMAINVK